LAARQATKVSAAHEAVALARRGLAMLERLPEDDERRDRELSLQIVLGNVLIPTTGWGSMEGKQTYLRARELCRELGDTSRLLPVLYGLSVNCVTKGKYRQALELGQELLELAEQQRDPAVIVARRVLGINRLFLGGASASLRGA
jgi:hypothetical protein